MSILIISWPWALLGSNPLIIFPMSLSVKEMLDKDLSFKLSKSVGSSLVFKNLLSWKIGGIQETVLPLSK